MTKLTEMTGDELREWYDNDPGDEETSLAALRDRIVAECAANLAEAERKGAREVAEWVLDYWQKNLTVNGSGYGADRNADGGQVGVFTRKLRSYLAAPAPRECVLSDGSVVTRGSDDYYRRCGGTPTFYGLISRHWVEILRAPDTGDDFEKVKSFAERAK